jgi:hypothetical protein
MAYFFALAFFAFFAFLAIVMSSPFAGAAARKACYAPYNTRIS